MTENRGESASEIISSQDWRERHDRQLSDDQGIRVVRRVRSSLIDSTPPPMTDADAPQADEDRGHLSIDAIEQTPQEPASLADLMDHPENFTEVNNKQLITAEGRKRGLEGLRQIVEDLRQRKAG